MKPLEGGIARDIAAGLKRAKLLRRATLIRPVSSLRMPGAVSQGLNPQPTSYPAQGFVTTTRKQKIGGTLVETSDRIIALVARGLAVDPKTGDKVTIDGVTSRVMDVEVDAARAVFTLLTRT